LTTVYCLFSSKCGINAITARTLKQAAVLGKDFFCVRIVLGLRRLNQLREQLVGFIAQQFGVRFQDAAGFVPGRRLDEGDDSLQKLFGVRASGFLTKQMTKHSSSFSFLRLLCVHMDRRRLR
jgi:hypothetical protein